MCKQQQQQQQQKQQVREAVRRKLGKPQCAMQWQWQQQQQQLELQVCKPWPAQGACCLYRTCCNPASYMYY
jgi:hypothetical protein